MSTTSFTKRILIAIVVLGLLTGSSCKKQSIPDPVSAVSISEFETRLDNLRKQSDIPGMVAMPENPRPGPQEFFVLHHTYQRKKCNDQNAENRTYGAHPAQYRDDSPDLISNSQVGTRQAREEQEDQFIKGRRHINAPQQGNRSVNQKRQQEFVLFPGRDVLTEQAILHE